MKPKEEIPEFLIQGKDQEGFEDRYINDFIGRGVFTTKKFSKGDFLLEYKGELVSEDEGYQREELYEPKLGSFLFFFKDGSKCLCLDATFSDGLGRLVNDEPSSKANCVMRKVKGGTKVYLALYALKNIEKGEELRYDYGVKDLPWRQLKGKAQVKDGKVKSIEVQEEDNNMNKDNSSVEMDERFPINITTAKDVSSMNQNNYISADSLQRFQTWKPGLCYKECWINDEGVNVYNALLARKFEKMGKAIYIFSSYFFHRWNTLQSTAPEKVLHSVNQVNLLEKEAWVIPINHKEHWKVVIVNLSTKTICLYDSIDHEKEDPIERSHLETIRNFIEQVYKLFGEKWTLLEWKQYIVKETPKQLNAFDCGIFSIKFVDYILSGKPLSFSQI